MSGPHTEAPGRRMPMSVDCAMARTPEQHERCVGRVWPGNRTDRGTVPCGCTHHDSQQTDSEQSTPRSTVRP